MTAKGHESPPPLAPVADTSPAMALRLALRLTHAETELQALTSGQIDAILDPDGRTYLLGPAQEHLRQSERRLQAVIDSVPEVITVVNRGGLILSQSHAASKVLRWEPDKLTGKSFFENVSSDDFVVVYAAFFNVIEEFNENAALQFRHRTEEGSYRNVQATVSRVRDSSPAIVVFSIRGTTHSVSHGVEKIREETTGAQARLAKDRFLAMLAHELRTPLAPALLGIQDLQGDERFAEARATLAMIRRNIELEKRLLDELLDFTSLGHRKIRLQSQWIDAHEAIRLTLETCRPEITAGQIQVLLDFRASEAMVLADSVKLQQVMWNLLKNAVKFSPEPSTISISTFNEPPDRLAIEFADHGVGIEPELAPFVFDSFQQGNLAQHQIHGGLGLGLFIAKGLAEAHGGTLTALSEGRDKGATFRLTLTKAPAGGVAPDRDDRPIEN